MSGTNDKTHSPAIDEDYNPHTFVHADVNHSETAQKCSNVT